MMHVSISDGTKKEIYEVEQFLQGGMSNSYVLAPLGRLARMQLVQPQINYTGRKAGQLPKGSLFLKVAHDNGAGITPQELKNRFKLEAQIMDHVSQQTGGSIIPQYYGNGIAHSSSGSEDAMLMQYLQGETIADFIAMRKCNAHDALKVILQIQEKAHALLQQKVMHRDLTPGNIMETTGLGNNYRLIDLGLAKYVSALSATQMFQVDPMGTPPYVAPERVPAINSVPVSLIQGEIYSLGAILYELLGLDKQALHDTYRTKQTNLPGTGRKDLDNVLSTALAYSPSARYQSMPDFRDALKKLQSDPLYMTLLNQANQSMHNATHVVASLWNSKVQQGMQSAYSNVRKMIPTKNRWVTSLHHVPLMLSSLQNNIPIQQYIQTAFSTLRKMLPARQGRTTKVLHQPINPTLEPVVPETYVYQPPLFDAVSLSQSVLDRVEESHQVGTPITIEVLMHDHSFPDNKHIHSAVGDAWNAYWNERVDTYGDTWGELLREFLRLQGHQEKIRELALTKPKVIVR